MARLGTFIQSPSYYTLIQKLLLPMVLKSARLERERNMEFVKAKLMKRIELGAVRPGSIAGWLKNKDKLVVLLLWTPV